MPAKNSSRPTKIRSQKKAPNRGGPPSAKKQQAPQEERTTSGDQLYYKRIKLN
ncbi:hypothetical protein DAPPUDRAFT_251371 [Daphnia pulex]|uniref:Uncharacterized protein n=1 Tax=Daphnia pulex TaxID=6669 RepID=E9H096_DAPPU|nr:hypothetical protein DAPPUDRAFT_251371 [Daphnia pulex]|eukprot:EFX74764.1 hypothetical protein DAPPUDRAFT_251371 [Daphnia pulex]